MGSQIKIFSLKELVKKKDFTLIKKIFSLMYELSKEMILKEIEISKQKFIFDNLDKIDSIKSFEEKRSILANYYDEEIFNEVYQKKVFAKQQDYDFRYKNINNCMNDSYFVCYYNNDEMIGLLNYSKINEAYNINKLYTIIKGKNIGTQLMDTLVNHLIKDNDLNTLLSIQVLTNNEDAKRLYERLGFRLIKDENGRDYIKNNSYYLMTTLQEYQDKMNERIKRDEIIKSK